jgi:hypothetical protein
VRECPRRSASRVLADTLVEDGRDAEGEDGG